MKNKSKPKGNKFESDIAKQLSLWISNNERDDLLFKTSGSGSRATHRMKNNQCTANSCGDLGYLDAVAEPYMKDYLFELKSGYTQKSKIVKDKKSGKLVIRKTGRHFSLADLLDGWSRGAKPLLVEWLDKAKKEAEQHDKKNFVIIYSRDYKDSCIVFQKDNFKEIEKNNYYSFNMHDGKIAWIDFELYSIVVVRLQDFLDWCKPESLYEERSDKIKKIKYRRGKYSGKNITKWKRKDL